MAFKLGSSRKFEARAGKIKRRFNFKAGNEIAPGTPVFRKKLDDGVLAEANNDGSIYVSKDIDVNSPMMQQAIAHEMQHITAMKIGHETYDDYAVYYKGETWIRDNGYVIDPNTGERYEEGSRELPWENNKI